MNIADVMDELGVALKTISGLKVYPFNADSVVPPAAIVAWPDVVSYDATFGRGSDTVTMPLYVLVGLVDARSARNRLAKYLDGSGSQSIKAAVDGGEYTACDSVTVREVKVEVLTVGAIDYLGATFDVDITGSGI